MAQEEKRVIIHFDTLEGFQARLTDGTLTEKGDYIVLIKDNALIWVKGQFFTGPSVLSIPKYIKDCEIIQENGNPLTLKFVGAEWNTEEKIYKEFNKTIELTLASTRDTSANSDQLQDLINSKGSANGIASLDEQGVVPSAQLPSYVDDVIDVYATYDKSAEGVLSNIQLFSNQEKTTPITPESGKIYIDVEGNYQFRWTGTQYATVGAPTVLGEVTGTAYDGGKGKALSDTINKMSDKVVVGPTIVTSSTNNVVIKYQTHFTSTNSNSEDSSTINAATTSQAGVMSAADKQKLDTINQAKTLSSATAGQWIRFAELSDSGYNSALVTIKEGTAGATFFFKCRSNGEVTVKVMDVTPNIYLTKIRVIKQNGQSNGYLEAYVDTASSSIAANISLSININLTDITVTSEIPGGYTSEEVSLV